MIRCNTLTLKYTNEGKKEIISNFISRYTEMVNKFVNVLWNSNFINTKPLVDNRVCQSISTKTHTDSRIRQCKGFKRAQDHRKNYINWSLNQLNFSNIKEVGLEKIRNIRRGKKSNRYLTHWTYTLIKDKLIRLSEDKGFVLIEQENKFMSQRCSACGWTHKSNRKGKTFKCGNCDFKGDSDLNAASNHEVELVELSPQVWQQHLNRTSGFYWAAVSDEPIVRHVQKPNYIHFS